MWKRTSLFSEKVKVGGHSCLDVVGSCEHDPEDGEAKAHVRVEGTFTRGQCGTCDYSKI
ncbi:MAG: hypothetical protein NVSMB52_01150 [Chloroflexota bacterium]